MKSIELKLLKATRESLGHSQEFLSELSGVSVRTIQRIESGNRTSVETAKSLASALHLDAHTELMEEKPEEDTKTHDTDTLEYLRENADPTRLFINTTISSLLIFIIPSFFWETADIGTLQIMMLSFSILALSGFASSTRTRSVKYLAACATFFTFGQWHNSAPTEGLWTVFYTEKQVEAFRATKEINDTARGIMDSFNQMEEELRLQSMKSMPDTADFGDSCTVSVDEKHKVHVSCGEEHTIFASTSLGDFAPDTQGQ